MHQTQLRNSSSPNVKQCNFFLASLVFTPIFLVDEAEKTSKNKVSVFTTTQTRIDTTIEVAGDGQNGLRNLDLNNLKRELKGAAGRYKAHTRCSKEGRCPPYYIEECISNQLLFCLKPPLKLSSRSVSQHLTELEFSMHNPTLYHFTIQNFTIMKIWMDFFFFHFFLPLFLSNFIAQQEF